MQFFETYGCPLKTERGKRVFPVSDRSADVLAALSRAMKQSGVLRRQGTAERLLLDNGRICGVADGTQLLSCAAAILCTGGVSYPLTGSTGDGYRMAAALGHTILPPVGSLVPLVCDGGDCSEMQGLSLRNVEIRICDGKKQLYQEFGEMLFTHFGISGPLVLSASPVCIKHMAIGELTAEIDLKPALSEEQLDARLLKDFEKYHNKQFHNALSDLLPAKLIPVIVDLSRIDPYKKVNEITRQERNMLLHLLKHLTMHISGLRGFNEAIITHGGISVKDVNASTMESKKCQDLYFAGEVLDVDALTGGYNLQIAWSTGWLAGTSIR